MKPKLNPARAVSWSMISCFEYDKEEWYRRYVLKQQSEPSKEMEFGKRFADSIEDGTCDYPDLLASLKEAKEHPFEVQFGGIRLKGFADAFDAKTFRALDEVKTGKRPWDRKRADEHGQIDMYLLMNYVTNRVRPEDVECAIYWCPTEERGDFSIQFVEPRQFVRIPTRRTMSQVLAFGASILRTYAEMNAYALAHE